MKLQMKSAEQAQRGMKEEIGRMKLLVQQTRNQCAVEVRKRERVVEGLKKHVGDGRVRGGGKTVGVREINVVAGVGAEQQQGCTMGVSDEGYDLRSETNEFLTELARGLSEENENMTALVRRTVETLRTLSGCEREGEIHQEGGMVVPIEMGYENLAQEMDAVIEHVRNLLTNPSFVPLEEVEVREEEIIRLREGWEKMESRWREAVQMMDGWRKRMARSGQTVNLEELKMGLLLSPLKPKEEGGKGLQLSTLMEEGEGDTQADIDAMDESNIADPVEPDFDDDMDDSDSSLFEDEPLDESPEETSEQEEQNWTLHSASIGPAPQLSPLRETSGNRPSAPNPPAKEKDGFTTIVEENTFDLFQLDAPSSAKQKSTPQTQHRNENCPGKLSTPPEDEVSLLKTSNLSEAQQSRSSSTSPRKHSRPTPKPASTPRLRTDNSSRLPRPRENALPQQSPLTMASIAAKLAASEREADAARVRAKIKAARMNKTGAPVPAQPSADPKSMPPPPRKVDADDTPAKRAAMSSNANAESTREDGDNDGRSRKRKATGRNQGGRASRRRSTLSPWELESLILGGVGQASPVAGES
jgi:hypothetical protein